MGLFGKQKTTEELVKEANRLYSAKEYLKAAIVLLKIPRSERCRNGAELEFMLGQCYFMDARNTGENYPRKEADKHFKIAAEAGNQKAQTALQTGGVPTAPFAELLGYESAPDLKPSAPVTEPPKPARSKTPSPEKKVQQKATEQPQASSNALQAYERKDFQTSISLWRKQSESLFGKAEAYYWLGISYLNGAGVDKNLDTAMEWAKKAKEKKYSSADTLIKAIEDQQVDRLRKQLARQIHTGDIFTLGSYRYSQSAYRLPIDWTVLDKQGNYIFAMAWNSLEIKEYHSQNKQVSWHDSSLRHWLNNDFYNDAFMPLEQKLIAKAPASAAENDAGNDDLVSLLSDDQLAHYLYRGKLSRYAYPPEGSASGLSYDYTSSSEKAEASIMSRVVDSCSKTYLSGAWWLRTAGTTAAFPNYVSWLGHIETVNLSVASSSTSHFLVRPVIWLKLDD